MAEHLLTQPAASFFTARDDFDSALYYGELKLKRTEIAMMRYLLENTLYKPRDPERYGYVAEAALGVRVMASMLGVSEKTAKRTMISLEGHGLIQRERRPVLSGGRKPDAIRVSWLFPKGTL